MRDAHPGRSLVTSLESGMSSTAALLYAATWFLFGMTRIVFTSAMVERRIDHPDPVKA